MKANLSTLNGLAHGRRAGLTMLVGVIGGGLAAAAGMPAGWVSGAMFAVAGATLAGFESALPEKSGPTLLALLGIGLGGAADPETLGLVGTFPVSFLILAASVVATVGLTGLFLARVSGWDRSTAFFASVPGALSFTLAAASETRADIRRVAVNQAVRLAGVVALAPVAFLFRGQAIEPAASLVAGVPLSQTLLLVAAGAAGAWLAVRASLPAGALLGAMIASAALFLSGLVEGRLPSFLLVPGLVYIGCLAGTRLRPGDVSLLPAMAGAALGAFTIGLAVGLVAALCVAALVDVPLLAAILAFVPGGIEVMTTLALAVEADPAYVAAHHLARFFTLALGVPLVARMLEKAV